MAYFEGIAAASLLPMETISVAMTSVPKSIPILSGIFKLSTDIRETTQRVEGNKENCQQLSERIDTLIGFLAERDLSERLNETMHIALRRFEAFLRRCLEFISTFLETGWFKRIMNNKDYEKKFRDLNLELTQYSNDLNFGIGLGNMQINKKQDENQSDKSDEFEKDSKQQKTSEMIDDNQQIGIITRQTTFVTRHSPCMSRARPMMNSEQVQRNIFVTGLWKYGYIQYNQYYGPFPQQLVFNPSSRTLYGDGEDNVGQYILNGSFSEITGQMKMTQTYQIGTGDPTLNAGHQDIIELSWNAPRKVFEGISYSKVQGIDIASAMIEMWFT